MYRRLVYSCRGFELVIALVRCQSILRLVAKLPINVSGVIALVLERFLNIYHYFIRRQIVIGKDRAVVHVADKRRIIAPRREPVAAIPIPVTAPIWATYIHDCVVMRMPIRAIMPDSMVSRVQRMRVAVA